MREKRFELKEVEAYTIEEIEQSIGVATSPLVGTTTTIDVSICGKIHREIKVDFETEKPRYSVAELLQLIIHGEKTGSNYAFINEKDKDVVLQFLNWIKSEPMRVQEALQWQ